MSGWTAVTIHGSDDETNEQLDTELREKYDGRPPWSATGYADRTVQVERGANHLSVAETLADEFAPDVEHVVVVSANDTSDSGFGTVFEVDNDTSPPAVTNVDEKEGYEGAKARDVTGYIKDEHGLDGYSSWEA